MNIQRKIFFILSIIALTFQAPTYTNIGNAGPFKVEAGNDVNDQSNIYIKITGTNPGYIALGMGESMLNYDVYQFPVTGTNVACEDYHSKDYTAATKDTGNESCSLINGTFQANVYTIEFKRPYAKQTDVEDQDINCGYNKIGIVYHNSSQDFTQKHTNYATLSLNIPKNNYPGCVDPPAILQGPSDLASKTPKEFTQVTTIQNDVLSLFYAFDQNDDQVIHFKITGITKGWISMALGNNMNNMDLVSFEYRNNILQMKDRYSTRQSVPFVDDVQSYYLDPSSKYDTQTGEWNVQFRRKLNTGDTKDHIIDKTKTQSISLAYHAKVLTFDAYHTKYSIGTMNISEKSSDSIIQNISLFIIISMLLQLI